MIENELNPIMTSMTSLPTSQALFPAISVDGGHAYDPMGFVRKAMNRYQPETDTDKDSESSL